MKFDDGRWPGMDVRSGFASGAVTIRVSCVWSVPLFWHWFWLSISMSFRRVDECLPKIVYTIQADGSLQQEDFKDSHSSWSQGNGRSDIQKKSDASKLQDWFSELRIPPSFLFVCGIPWNYSDLGSFAQKSFNLVYKIDTHRSNIETESDLKPRWSSNPWSTCRCFLFTWNHGRLWESSIN